jgi:hypothetical protein
MRKLRLGNGGALHMPIRFLGRFQPDGSCGIGGAGDRRGQQERGYLEGTQKRHQILLLLCLELCAEDQVEEFDRVFQGQ